MIKFSISFLLLLLLVSCYSRPDPFRIPPVKYFDRNGDGKVDREYHGSQLQHARWDLFDNDFDGRYEMKLEYKIGPKRTVVDIPVAKNVKISANDDI